MSTTFEAYVDALFAFTPEPDHCVARIYANLPGSPDVPDLASVLATSGPEDPPATSGSVPATTTFTFSADPVLTPGDSYWLGIERTGALQTFETYRGYFDSNTEPFATYRPALTPLWQVNSGPGWCGEFILAGETVFSRSPTGAFTDFGHDGSAFFAEKFTPVIISSGARIWTDF